MNILMLTMNNLIEYLRFKALKYSRFSDTVDSLTEDIKSTKTENFLKSDTDSGYLLKPELSGGAKYSKSRV